METGRDGRYWWAVASIALLCFIWLAGEVAQGRTAAFDDASRAALHSAASPPLTFLMRAATALGTQAVILGIAGCAVLGLLLSGDRGRAGLMVIGVAGAEILLAILKAYFERRRPDPFFGALTPASYSFPSGHALLSMCCYGLLAAVAGERLRGPARWAMRIAAAALILAIGASRVYLGFHYASDVIAGYLAAIGWCGIAIGLFRRTR